MKNFKELKVWERSHCLTLAIYRITASFPKEELYGLTSQMRRASSSVAANIAEGYGRQGDAEFARFLQISMGSASELAYHLLLAHDPSLLESSKYKSLAEDVGEIKRMLTSFIFKLRAVG